MLQCSPHLGKGQTTAAVWSAGGRPRQGKEMKRSSDPAHAQPPVPQWPPEERETALSRHHCFLSAAALTAFPAARHIIMPYCFYGNNILRKSAVMINTCSRDGVLLGLLYEGVY